MSESKPFASLGPLLLARKGSARPVTHGQIEAAAMDMAENENDALFAEPAIKRQQSELLHRIADSNQAQFEADRDARSDNARRAAFTLRLDGERHLRLKLASTVKGISAQQLLTRALDQLLADMPDIEALAAQVKRNSNPA